MISPTSAPPADVISSVAGSREAAGPQNQTPQTPGGPTSPKRKGTAQFKFVPETLAHREQIRNAAEKYAKGLDKSKPFSRNELEQHGRRLLEAMEEPEKFLGFTMVMIGNFFWREQFLAIPFHRRMLLLPHCLKHAEGCPADYDEFGLDCERCGACSIADYKVKAEQLGYKVLVAEGSPIVLKIIVSGHIDGILGVACLNVLEKAIDKILIAGVPSYAVPLHSGDCKNTTLDESWVWECLDKYQPLESEATHSYVPLMRSANDLFDKHFDSLTADIRAGKPAGQAPPAPLSFTETVVFDWLRNGGKRLRPFVTLAAYDALTGHSDSLPTGAPITFPPHVARVAMAIEGFHKASLIHDDIQDGDQYRYGQETLHRQHGVPSAINLGDHLIGTGYRLVSSSRKELGAEVAADITDRFAVAHMRLCDGQGAELRWSQSVLEAPLTPLDALKIYALKTSPAFEAALYAGIRMAGPAEAYEELIVGFSRHLGVGFQILNDLADWRGDEHNKLVAGQDGSALRPTILWALAWDGANEGQRAELKAIATADVKPEARAARLKGQFESQGIFAKAEALLEKSRQRAEALVEKVESVPLQNLLHYILESVLAEEPEAPNIEPPVVMLNPRFPREVAAGRV